MDPLTIISAGISSVGSLFKGLTGFFGGNAEAKIAEQNARQAQEEGGVAASQALAQGDQVAARAATQAAANGGGFTGSALSVISSLSQQAMFNARAAAYKARTAANAELYRGSVAKTQGLQGLVTSAADAGSSLIGGFAKSANNAKLLQMAGGQGASGADPSAFTDAFAGG